MSAEEISATILSLFRLKSSLRQQKFHDSASRTFHLFRLFRMPCFLFLYTFCEALHSAGVTCPLIPTLAKGVQVQMQVSDHFSHGVTKFILSFLSIYLLYRGQPHRHGRRSITLIELLTLPARISVALAHPPPVFLRECHLSI